MVDWQIQVPNLRVEKPNVTGVGLRAVRNLIAVAGNEHGIKGVRDRAIIRVFFDLALRRAEVCSLDLGDVDLANQRVTVKRKGHHDKTTLSLPEPTCQALREWVERRGGAPGPLFFTLQHGLLGHSRRLTPPGIYYIVTTLGTKAGIKVHPHQLRHDAITQAVISAKDSGIGLEEVMDYSGHRQIGTLLIYRDRERNVQGQLAGMVAAKV
jgi:integrase/recombinase XerC